MNSFFYMEDLMRTHVENDLDTIIDLRGQNIDVSDQDVFVLKYMAYMVKK